MRKACKRCKLNFIASLPETLLAWAGFTVDALADAIKAPEFDFGALTRELA